MICDRCKNNGIDDCPLQGNKGTIKTCSAFKNTQSEVKMTEQKQFEVKKLKSNLIERETLDEALNLALLTKEHLLISGKPGTGKSMAVENIFKQVANSELFSVQLSKFSTEEVLFGIVDIEKLRKGEFTYAETGKTILNCEFAFIDEIFDASDVLLRSLLGVLNERRFEKGNFKREVPLMTCVGTCNYTRLNEITDAVVDRFLFQTHVSEVENKKRLVGWENPEVEPKYNVKYLEKAQEKVQMIDFPSRLIKPLIMICKELGFSDRRVVKSVKVLKAKAFLEGRNKVKWQDMRAIKYLNGLTEDSKNQVLNLVENLVEKKLNIQKQLEIIEALDEEWKELGGNNQEESHLKREYELIQELTQISPVHDEVYEERDRLISKWRKHYSGHRQKYIDRKFKLPKIEW